MALVLVRGEQRAKGPSLRRVGGSSGGGGDHCYKFNTYIRHDRSCVTLGSECKEVT
jgi:hypothetical protein